MPLCPKQSGSEKFIDCFLDRREITYDAQNMSRIKTFTLILLAFFALARPALASGDLHIVFAGCVGRFSAEMEHAWLMGDGSADTYEGHRSAFISLMEATMPEGSGSRVLHQRLDHKMAHASLLTLATFGTDARRARAASLAAKSYRLECEQLLLRG